jgi:uncharacterized protein
VDSTGGSRPPAPGISPLRWGVFDAAVVWVLSLMAAALALAPFVEEIGDETKVPRADEVLATVVGLVVQTGVAVALLLVIASYKGLGSLRADFGFRLRVVDVPWFLAGLGIALVAAGILQPIIEVGDYTDKSQDVVRIFDQATGAGENVLLVLSVLVVAPLGEELLFRGALLRGLQRRIPAGQAIFASALLFALVHVFLDPGAAFAIPGLVLLGLVSAWRAVETGNLSQSLYLHAGFNLWAAIFLLT